MNWLILVIFGIFVIALIVFLVVRNQKDEADFVQKLNNDYPKPKSGDGDIEIDKLTDEVR